MFLLLPACSSCQNSKKIVVLNVQKWSHSFASSKTPGTSPLKELNSGHLHYWTTHGETIFNFFALEKAECLNVQKWSHSFASSKTPGTSPLKELNSGHLHYWTTHEETIFNVFALAMI